MIFPWIEDDEASHFSGRSWRDIHRACRNQLLEISDHRRWFLTDLSDIGPIRIPSALTNFDLVRGACQSNIQLAAQDRSSVGNPPKGGSI